MALSQGRGLGKNLVRVSSEKEPSQETVSRETALFIGSRENKGYISPWVGVLAMSVHHWLGLGLVMLHLH